MSAYGIAHPIAAIAALAALSCVAAGAAHAADPNALWKIVDGNACRTSSSMPIRSHVRKSI